MKARTRLNLSVLAISISWLVLSCQPAATDQPTPSTSNSTEPVDILNTLSPVSSPTKSPVPQSITAQQTFGPDQENFPSGYNPLTGQSVENPDLLTYPAMLVSISHFPATARPQAGLSFAQWVFEYYITEGATRFLSVFYGELPQPEIPITGNCEIYNEPFIQTSNILGNQVWLDVNKNGRHEPYEKGVGGVCLQLYQDGQLIKSTTTDSNGYYGFNVEDGNYTVEFTLPEWLVFTSQNIGDENNDSDADPFTGRADAEVKSTHLYIDAGLIPSETSISAESEFTKLPTAEIGPVRSGRLLYADIADFFQDSCLIYAFASQEVLSQIPHCAMVAHEFEGGGSMLPLERFKEIAEDKKLHSSGQFNYASNLLSDEVPQGGEPANQINVYVALLNQSGWRYDPLSGAWMRYVDDSTKENAGILHPEVDRLTGCQLLFENVIIIFAEHNVISSTNLDIHLEQGDEGTAFLFRNGMKYDIKWSTRSGEYEKQTGQRRPIQFVNLDGDPAALKPGHTWIFVATPYSIVSNEGAGVWKLRYYAPEGSE